MIADTIEAIGIDAEGSLWVKPATARFPHIYREAMEVFWDAERLCLYGPKPREWSYVRWFERIRIAAYEQGVALKLGPATAWSGIDPELRQAILYMDRHDEGSLAGMTVNERLLHVGTLDRWEAAVRQRDRDTMIALLEQVEVSNPQWSVDRILARRPSYDS